MSNNFELLSQLELADRPSPVSSDAPSQSPTDRKAGTNGRLPSSYSEAHSLVQRVFLSQPELAPHIVVFTSPQSGTGCSWVCARTSEALADRFPGAVCLVDANLRSPAMHRHFAIDNSRGLTQALVETNPICYYAQEIRGRKLSVLTAGSSDTQVNLCNSDRLVQRLAELRRSFSFLLIDSAATNLYADVELLSSLADGAILVLEVGSTRRDAALQARDALVAAKFRVLGVALNKRTFPIPEFIYNRL